MAEWRNVDRRLEWLEFQEIPHGIGQRDQCLEPFSSLLTSFELQRARSAQHGRAFLRMWSAAVA